MTTTTMITAKRICVHRLGFFSLSLLSFAGSTQKMFGCCLQILYKCSSKRLCKRQKRSGRPTAVNKLFARIKFASSIFFVFSNCSCPYFSVRECLVCWSSCVFSHNLHRCWCHLEWPQRRTLKMLQLNEREKRMGMLRLMQTETNREQATKNVRL